MRLFKTQISLALCLFLVTVSAHAQQQQIMSTRLYNGLTINPAYAGSLNIFSASLTHRDQWVNIDGAPNLQAFTAHTSVWHNLVGVGFMAMRDEIGDHVENSFAGMYSYKIPMSHGILSLGLQASVNYKYSDFSGRTFLNPEDPLFVNGRQRFRPNFGTGVYYANPKWFFGLSVPFIMQPKHFKLEESTQRDIRTYYMATGAVWDLTNSIKIHPYTILTYKEGNELGYDITANLIFEEMAYAGLTYRRGGEMILLMQLVLNDNFRFGYAYDIVTNQLGQYSAGSHEIMLTFRRELNISRHPKCPLYF